MSNVSQPQPAQQTEKKDFNKQFMKVLGSRIFGASRSVGLPDSTCGIVFYTTDVLKRDPSGKPYRYKTPHIGKAIALTQDQINQITRILNVDEDPFVQRK